MKHKKPKDNGDAIVIWILGIMFLSLNAVIGFGVVIGLDDIQTTLQLMDQACS